MRYLRNRVFSSLGAVVATVSVLIITSFVSGPLAQAGSDIYIAQSATGLANGADCADAYALSFFNSSSNWASTPTSGKIGPGTTVHLCGTFTATAGTSSYLMFQGSGMSGSPITLVFEPGAVLTATYWSGPVINLEAQSYITVNGGTNGTIQATANGTNLANQQDNGECVASQAANATNVIVENLTCADLYIDAAVSDNGGEDTYGIDIWGTSNLVIQNNTIHDVKWGIRNSYSTGSTYSNLTVTGNTIYNIDHGWFGTDSSNSGTATMSGWYIYNNIVHDFQNWDNTADNNHHDGFHLNTNSASSNFTNFYLYDNYIYGTIGSFANSLFYSYPESVASESNIWVFNNVFVNSSPTYCMANGFVALAGVGTQYVIDNTFISLHTSCTEYSGQQEAGYISGYGSTGITAENNIFINTTANALQFTPSVGTITATDYNDFYENSSWEYNANYYSTLAAWQGAHSSPVFDAHSITTNPNLTGSYAPNSGSPVIGAGINLYSICNGQPNPGIGALCYDKGGAARPSSGAWDMGAYKYTISGNGTQSLIVGGGAVILGLALLW